MPKNQKGFAHHFILFAVVLVGVALIGLAVAKAQHKKTAQTNQASGSTQTQQSSRQNPASQWAQPQVYAQLPDCTGNQVLDNMPVEAGVAYDIIPLGLINATGGHAYPSDHTYFNFEGRQGTYNVVSPGTIYITKVRRISRTLNGATSSDASIYFMPCKQVAFYFNHVQPTDALNQAVPSADDPKTNSCAMDKTQGSHQNTQNFTTDSDCTQLATKLVKLTPGQLMATSHVTQNQVGFDFGALDARAPALKLLNPASEGDASVNQGLTYLKSVCPISYMPTSVQQAVFAKPGFAKRPAATKCGEIAQDKLGTIQGDWYEGAHVSYTSDWTKELAVVHYNVDPSLAEISVGGTLGPGGILAFTPSTGGTINPEPSSTKVGPLYCFTTTVGNTSSESDPSYAGGHKLLLQLTDSKTMKAEYQTGSCTGHDSFNQPSTYYR